MRYGGSRIQVRRHIQHASPTSQNHRDGQAQDAPYGRALLKQLGPTERAVHLRMDRAHEGNETRALAAALGFTPVVPPSLVKTGTP